MAVTAKPVLGGSMLVRDWYLDVNTTPSGAATWVGLGGIVEFDPKSNPVFTDDSDTAGGGANSEIKVADQWVLTVTVRRAAQAADPDAYDIGQEYVRAQALKYGRNAVVAVRWYEANGSGAPLGESWQGEAAVSWEEQESAEAGVRRVQIVFRGRGARTAISPHPASA
jgi:hypothetical protein